MKPGSTGGTWEVSWDGEDRESGSVHRIVKGPGGVPVPRQEGRIFKGEAARRRRQEVNSDE